ncbi:MAG: ThuA domain-containing protein, partial [Clostridia bacterium]|nr:ThuA domain-containing protein [Clostridia bacterium]
EGGMNATLKEFIESKYGEVKYFVHGADDDGSQLTEEILLDTDVLVWWGHWYHGLVSDEVANRVVNFVNRGMGLVVLHSGHESKPFQRLVGTTGALSWREMGENERVWIIERTHPVFEGVEGDYIDIEHEEMYGEPFDIPAPDELLGISWFRGGEIMRSVCVFNRGYGKVIFFRPGHETLPTYKIDKVQKVVLNCIDYAKPSKVRLNNARRSKHVPNPPEKI